MLHGIPEKPAWKCSVFATYSFSAEISPKFSEIVKLFIGARRPLDPGCRFAVQQQSPMPYDRSIESQIDRQLGELEDIAKKKMSGAVCHLLLGNVCFGI
jgi:hypothetical protein